MKRELRRVGGPAGFVFLPVAALGGALACSSGSGQPVGSVGSSAGGSYENPGIGGSYESPGTGGSYESPGGGGSFQSGGTGGTGGGGGVPTCQGAQGPGSSACTACIESSCGSVSAVEQSCGAYFSCYEACSCTDDACLSNCLSSMDANCSAAFTPFESCVLQSCATACATGTTSSGDGG